MIVVKALDDENDGNSEEYDISDFKDGDFVYFSKILFRVSKTFYMYETRLLCYLNNYFLSKKIALHRTYFITVIKRK